jgi:hypothetical protein
VTAAAAELIPGLEIEGANDRAHGARFAKRVDQPGSEQRHLEQKHELYVVILEQLVDHLERLTLGHGEKVAADRRQ